MEGCEDQPREGDRTLTRASQGSTGRTALPEHEARGWECGSKAGGVGSHSSGTASRAAGPGPPTSPVGGSAADKDGEREARNSETTSSWRSFYPPTGPASLPRSSTSIPAAHPPTAKGLATGLVHCTSFLRHLGAHREPDSSPSTRSRPQLPHPAAEPQHPRQGGGRKGGATPEEPSAPAHAAGGSGFSGLRLCCGTRVTPSGWREQDPSFFPDLRGTLAT